LVQLSPLTIEFEAAYVYHLVYPPALRDWPPVNALRGWLHEELERSMLTLHPPAKKTRARTKPAGR
jgi:LysR family glycine cleavage system transcriptional activator